MDEITFFDIWKILVAKKWVVLSVPIITLLLGILYLMQVTVVYESSARILVGQVDIGQPVESPAIIVQSLLEKYGADIKKARDEFPRVSTALFDKKETGNIVLIKALDTTAKGAKLYLEQVVDEILAKQIALFAEEMELKQSRLETLSDRLETVRTFQQELDKRIAKMDREEPAQATVLAVEKGGFLRLAFELESERYVLQSKKTSRISYPAEVLKVPSLPEKPIKPRKAGILLSFGILGLLLGVVAAFIAEFLLIARYRV